MGTKPAPRPGAFALAIADAVRRELGSRKMSGRSIAVAIGVSEKYIRSRLNDQLAFSFEDIDRICGVFGLSSVKFVQDVANSLED